MSFKLSHTFYERKSEFQNIVSKYPHKFPIICEKSTSSSNDCPDIDKNKYLVSNELTIGQFLYIIRKRLKITPEKALYIFINGIIPATSDYICNIYHHYKDEDGFLYITYTTENTFG